MDDQSKLIASMQAQQRLLDEQAASGDSASEALAERCGDDGTSVSSPAAGFSWVVVF